MNRMLFVIGSSSEAAPGLMSELEAVNEPRCSLGDWQLALAAEFAVGRGECGAVAAPLRHGGVAGRECADQMDCENEQDHWTRPLDRWVGSSY